MSTPDTAGGTAGAAAAASGGAFLDQLFEADDVPQNEHPDGLPPVGTPPPPPPVGTPPPPPPPPPAEEELPEFESIEPPAVPRVPAPPAPLTPVDEDPVPDHVTRKGEAAVTTWKAARAEAKQLKQRLEDIERDRAVKETELLELRQKLEQAPPEEKLKELEEQVKKYEDELGRIDVSRSKAFQDRYVKPVNELFSKVVRTFIKAGRDEKHALELARSVFKPGMNDVRALEQALPDESSVVVGAVSALLEDRDALVAKHDAALQEWRQTREATEIEERRRAASEMGEQLTRVSASAIDAAVKDGSWLFKPGEDEQWNKGVQARRDAVAGYLRAGKPEDIARLVAEGIASPVYRKGYEQLRAAYEDLRGKYEALTASRPGLRNRAPAPDGSPAPVPRPKNLDEFIGQEFDAG